MKRTRQERIVSVNAKRPRDLRVIARRVPPTPERHAGILELLYALLDDRIRSGRR